MIVLRHLYTCLLFFWSIFRVKFWDRSEPKVFSKTLGAHVVRSEFNSSSSLGTFFTRRNNLKEGVSLYSATRCCESSRATVVNISKNNNFTVDLTHKHYVSQLISLMQVLHADENVESVLYRLTINDTSIGKHHYGGHDFVIHQECSGKFKIYQSYIHKYSLDYYMENFDDNKNLSIDAITKFLQKLETFYFAPGGQMKLITITNYYSR